MASAAIKNRKRERNTNLFFKEPQRAPLILLAEADGDDVPSDVELIRVGTFFHEQYGKLNITPKELKSFVKNFNDHIRRVDLAIDYKHENEDIAAGWIKKVYLSEDGNSLWAKVKWTPNGKRVLADQEFRYLSAEFIMDYQDNETLRKFGPTLMGAGLTNRPFVKGMEPTNQLSESQNKEGDAMNPDEMKAALQNAMARIAKLEKGAGGAKAPAKKAAPAADPDADEEQKESEDPEASDDSADADDAEDATEDDQQQKVSKGAKNPPEQDDTTEENDGDDEEQQLSDNIAMKEKELSDMQSKLGALKKKKLPPAKDKAAADAQADPAKLAEKKKSFAKMLSEGKVIKAQEKAFLSGDMVAFAEQAKPMKAKRISLNEQDADQGDDEDVGGEDPQDAIIALAEKHVADKKEQGKKVDIGDAISFVLTEPKNKNLANKYQSINFGMKR